MAQQQKDSASSSVFSPLRAKLLSFKMRTPKHLFSPFLCCFGFHSHDEDHPAADLKSLPNPASALSVSLPAHTVPHSQGHSGSHAADADALRQIFRSSSSVRGYQTASRPHDMAHQRQSSFDNDFGFGHKASSERKQPGRIGQLGSHIKQKLSESRLSKSSSKAHMGSEDAPQDLAIPERAPLSVAHPEVALSQRSTGLLELLMSRSGSEGGYDSDAKSIQTAMLKASDGTLKLSPQAARALLRSPTGRSSVKHERAQTSPTKLSVSLSADQAAPSTPMSNVLLTKKDESPSLSLKRLDDTVTGGTRILPGRSDLPAATSLAWGDAITQHVNGGSPSRASTRTHHESSVIGETLKRPSDTIVVAKRDSLLSNAENPRTSLVSNLDPALIGLISRYGERSPMDADDISSPAKLAGNPISSSPIAVDGPSSRKNSVPDKDDASDKDMRSLTESEGNSIHLYNMRISQRLASPHLAAATSRPNTGHTTANQSSKNSTDAWPTTSQACLAGRPPGTIAAEHNRRPSDPHTRRLFEDESTADGPRQRWRPVTSGSYVSQSGVPRSPLSQGDASSFYESDAGVGDHEEVRRHSSKRNPNSIAIGGRSGSISLPLGSSSGSISQLSVAEESAWFSRKSSQQQRDSEVKGHLSPAINRNRSVSMPDKTEVRRPNAAIGFGKRPQKSTKANAPLSETDVEKLKDARREQLTEISAQAVRDTFNERMSEIDPQRAGLLIKTEQYTARDHSSFLPRQRQLSTASQIAPDERRPESADGRPELHESTTDLWRRTIKRAMDEPNEDSLGGFLTAPKFDRDGRRRSTRSSFSTVESHEGHPPQGPAVHQKQPSPASEGIPCGDKQEKLTTIVPKRSIAIMETMPDQLMTIGERKRKKSLLDFGWRSTMSHRADEEEHGSGTSTPLKELLGIWGRFPSHTRNERCGAAGTRDGVVARDFAQEGQDENAPADSAYMTPWTGSSMAEDSRTPGSLRMLSFGRKERIDKNRTKSMPLPRSHEQSLALRAKKSRKGLVGRWKKLYRSSSSDLKAYIHTYGHRTSISLGASVAHPELEVIPGFETHYDGRAELDGTAPSHGRHQREASALSEKVELPPMNEGPWTQTYRDCVGSMSALRSDADIRSMSEWTDHLFEGGDHISKMKSTELRSSTADFAVELCKELEAAKGGLIKKIESTSLADRLDVPQPHLKLD
ncbi:hypothetical protein LTR47_003050 [Exophiala xenobiotica]|nr:hypothetical protein LTR47_003050 [Exophiala xenobiotica]KAK5252932.1 hypothetical protein LTS06_002644 [Exophiala xenobiotica]KAK5353809.1 hypothetical protein LTR61_002503 [Exophiala xenobiotica]KAK5370618.1 hypothetical protein LTR11_006829 [Exophiala xenobiotica]